MLEYDRIDILQGTDVKKTNLSKECDICHYWYFKDIGFKYEPYLCNRCHDLMQKAMTLIILLLYMSREVRKGDAINIIMVLTWLIKVVFYKNYI